MKFVDEAIIKVIAGKGGNGCLSFRREKYVPFGGPDGGDGGDGGSVFLQATDAFNTLVDFRYRREYAAQSGQSGQGSNCQGKSGSDLVIAVPVGTVIYDNNTLENLGDLTQNGQKLLVAQGGFHGLGNARYKSSTNRAPRQTSKGSLGEERQLKLELKLLADVGLLGLPNAGKSTFLRAVSASRAKVADYPFTTIHPNLGVVRLSDYQSFVIADIPGLIHGAAQGAGLGIQFLKHLARTQVLLHIVDIAPYDETSPIESIQTIIQELQQFDSELASKERWLVLNQCDKLDPTQVTEKKQAIIEQLGWNGPVYTISALNQTGIQQLCLDLRKKLNHISAILETNPP